MSKYKNTLVRSFIVVPLLMGSLSMNTVTASISEYVQTKTIPVVQVVSPEQQAKLDLEREEAAKIDAYFSSKDLPLAGHGMTFVTAADANGLPYNLLAAQGMAESTGCLKVISGTNNCFGWGNGKIKFDSVDQAIIDISANLGGNNPHTAQYYDGKSVKEILEMYNPPKIAPEYISHVTSIMAAIDNMPVN